MGGLLEQLQRSIIEQNDTNGSTSSNMTIVAEATQVPTILNLTDSFIEAELIEEEHVFDANASLALNFTLIVCLLLAYYVKKFKIYYLTESAGALIVGMIIGGIARLTTDNLQLFEFVSN